jgi:hypothetical protein
MISQEEIESFLHGDDPEEYIVSIEFDYASDSIYKIKEIPEKGKEIRKDTFTPFAWVGDLRGLNFYQSSKGLQKEAMSKHGIMIEKLETGDNPRLENGLKFMVKSLKGYRSLIQFFKEGGVDPWGERTKDKVLILPPVEQYLIQKGKRLFKGFEEYNDITRLVFDLETTSLEPKDGRIFMIGIKNNKGFKKVIECADEEQERKGLVEFFRISTDISWTISVTNLGFGTNWVSGFISSGTGDAVISGQVSQNTTNVVRSVMLVVNYCGKTESFTLTQGRSKGLNVVTVVRNNKLNK